MTDPRAAPTPGRYRLVHVITGLSTGGAEAMLAKLLGGLDPARWSCEVISLSDRGTHGDRLERLGVPVTALELATPSGMASGLFQLRRRLRQFRPSLIQGWMYHGNLAALAGAGLAGRPPVIWNLRQSLYGLVREKRLTAQVIRLGARLSRLPRKIVYNSATSARQHEALGYDASRTVLIPNGFDTERLRPAPEARAALRARLGVSLETPIVGHLARYHPMKDHAGFLRAAARVTAVRPGTIFLLAGHEVDDNNAALRTLTQELGIGDSTRRLGELVDPMPVIAGLDVLALSSAWGEGFPNVLGEAMACGIPCVTTDIGDSRWVVGDSGEVVPPLDPDRMAAALLRLLALSPEERSRLGAVARRRIEVEFSLPTIISAYESLYLDLLASDRPGAVGSGA